MLKRLFVTGLIISLGVVLLANPLPLPAHSTKAFKQTYSAENPALRIPPPYTFTRLPYPVMTSYYDYMVGGYNNLPLWVIPSAGGGGYFMTYQGSRTSTAQRRAFYTYFDAAGNLINNNEISPISRPEGYPTLVVDPVSGKPLYAWQSYEDADPQLEVLFTTDAFFSGIAGLFNDNQTVINNPITIITPGGITSTNNEFIWPSLVIGPSPIAGKRRAYLLGRNATESGSNIYLARADFSGFDIENGVPFTWTYSSIPELNDWAVDPVISRSPSLALVADGGGHLYLVGYHNTLTASGEPLDEGDLDIFLCSNYGMGTWTHVAGLSDLPSWNPPANPESTLGYFTDEFGVPYADSDLSWKIMNSGHLNATLDDQGRIHIPGIWGLSSPDGNYPDLQVVKEVVYNTATNTFEIKEIYPQNNIDNTNSVWYQPWDIEAPWGQVDAYDDNGSGGLIPRIQKDWPFPHWDATAHDGNMLFYYNNLKVTTANDQDMMAAVWQSSYRARQFNFFQNPAYSDYVDTPEIYISVSPNNGLTWLAPIVLNNVDTPQFAGLKPMWVYPADQVIFTGMQGNDKVGKLGLMFYNDNTWGANSQSPSYHPSPTGGQIMFAELQIVFSGTPNSNTVAPPVFSPPAGNYPSPCLVTLSTSTSNAQIRFTTDGSVPTTISPVYTNPIELTNSTTVRARAYRTNWEPSDVVSASYQLPQEVAVTTFSPPSGTYYVETNVTLSTITANAQIRYTTDGSIPTETSPLYQSPIHLPLESSVAIVARAFRDGFTPSPISSAGYTVTGTVQNLVIEPTQGIYAEPIQVFISCSTPEAEIHYTLDGSTPLWTSTLYTEAIPINQSTTVKARGFRLNWAPSPIYTVGYQIGLANQDEVISVTGIRKAYPNPFSGNLHIEIGIKEARQDYNLNIYNIKGECVHKHQGSAQGLFLYQWTGVDERGLRLPAGIYLLQLEVGAQRSLQKVILK